MKHLVLPVYRTVGQALIWGHPSHKDGRGVGSMPPSLVHGEVHSCENAGVAAWAGGAAVQLDAEGWAGGHML